MVYFMIKFTKQNVLTVKGTHVKICDSPRYCYGYEIPQCHCITREGRKIRFEAESQETCRQNKKILFFRRERESVNKIFAYLCKAW